VTPTATWLLPIAIIPGTWQVYEIPTTPQITEGQMPPQPEPNWSDNATSQEPDQGEALGTPSSSHTSKHQPPQGYWNPNYSVMWTPQNMDTLIRCILLPALFATYSRIIRRARIRHQRRVTRHRRMGTINSQTLSKHPKRMNLRRTNLPRRH